MNSNLPLDPIAAAATSFASANGLQVVHRQENTDLTLFECAPISLLPNAYPRTAFRQAQSVATAFNTLVDQLSRNADFLTQTLRGVVQADPYTAKLLELYQKIYVDDPRNPAHSADRLGIHRSDYMLHRGVIQQVELNTIASSFGALSCQVTKLHRLLSQRFDSNEIREFFQQNKRAVLMDDTAVWSPQDGVPENPALEKIPAALQAACQSYQSRFQTNKCGVLFVVQEGERNTVDQRLLEFALWEQYRIPVLRQSLTQLYGTATVNDDGILMVDGNEVAVVYYRAGYTPTDYPDGDQGIEWQARARLEASRAAKCPSLGYHLAGTKKVQQELARPGVLERFVKDDEQVKQLRAVFAGLYSLGNDASEQDFKAVQDVMDGNEKYYVLKPQREGGGYNFYGERLAQKVKANVMTDDHGKVTTWSDTLAEYILMERLFPPSQKAILLRSGRVEGTGDTISELGCFGTILCDPNGHVLHNEYAGFLLRTKFSNVDEGGVASGFATLSSPYLC